MPIWLCLPAKFGPRRVFRGIRDIEGRNDGILAERDAINIQVRQTFDINRLGVMAP